MSERRVASRSSNTAEVNAAQRAAESLRPPGERIVDDPYAHWFVQRPFYRLLATRRRPGLAGLRFIESRYGGLNAIILLRARYSTEAVREASEDGIEQVLLFGAGYDSMAHRHDGPPVRFFELDAPTTQQAKLRCLEAHEPNGAVEYVACDLERDSPRGALEQAGFDRARRSIVVWLGVSYYLTREAFERSLADIAALSASGSRLVLDYMDAEMVDGTTPYAGGRRLNRTVRRRGEPYRLGFGEEELRRTLADTGFEVRDHARLPELARRYGAWCRTDDWAGVVTAERA